MILVIKPAGQGNYARVTMTIEGKHSPVFECMHGMQLGQRFELAGVTWVVCEVRS